MLDDKLVISLDGRQYSRDADGTLTRLSIVKLNKKGRRKLIRQMREAQLVSGAPVLPLADIPEPESRWKDSDERKKILAEMQKDVG